MKPLLVLLLLLNAFPAAAVSPWEEQNALLDRIHHLVGDHLAYAAAYSLYASGRPRVVVAASQLAEPLEERGVIWLLRFPDSHRGPVKVLQKLDIDMRPVELQIVRLIDRKDVLVTFMAPHSPPGIIYRVAGNRLVRITTDDYNVYWGFLAVDIDHDGVPELISTGCCDRTPCGIGIFVGVLKYDGRKYKSDGRRYIQLTGALAGRPRYDDNLIIPEPPDGMSRKRYAIHIINVEAGRARVQLDGRDIVSTTKPRHFTTVVRRMELDYRQSPNNCHTLSIQAWGPPRSEVHVLVEELK